jgi:hypothetical protein
MIKVLHAIRPPDQFKIPAVMLRMTVLTFLVSAGGMESLTGFYPVPEQLVTTQTITGTDLLCHGMAFLAVGQTFQISVRAGKISGRQLGRSGAEIQQQ